MSYYGDRAVVNAIQISIEDAKRTIQNYEMGLEKIAILEEGQYYEIIHLGITVTSPEPSSTPAPHP